MNYWSSFLNPISSDIVCLINISIEFMSNYFEIMKYFEIALFKKFPNPVLLKLHANTKGYMLPKHVYCIPANWNFTLLESKLQILFFVLIKQANNQLFKQISRISFQSDFDWVYLPVKSLLRSGSFLNCKYLPTSPLITSRFVQMVSTAVIYVYSMYQLKLLQDTYVLFKKNQHYWWFLPIN